MEKEHAKKIIESLLYMTDHPLTPKEIVEVLDDKTMNKEAVREILDEIKSEVDASESALQMIEVAGGVQMATRQDVAPWVRRLFKERLTVRLSSSALETLSIIAYKQPIARSEIEQIRGVEATGVMDTLLERRLVKVVGRKETIGRPLLYGTTPQFLRQFGLNHLSSLPDLETITPAPVTEGDLMGNKEEQSELVPVGGEPEQEAGPEEPKKETETPPEPSPN